MYHYVKGSTRKVTQAISSLKTYWLNDASFVVLLGMLLFTVFILPILIEYEHVGEVFISAVFLFLFFTGIASSRKPLLITLTAVLFLTQLSLRIIRFSTFDFEFYLAERFVGILNMIVFIFLNIRLLFRNEEISVYRIIGAVNVYLLVAILGAFVFEIIYLTTESAIAGEVFLEGNDQDFALYIYFSMVSLTTVGFGDIYPVQIIAKMLSTFLSMIGILYPAVIIAKLVSSAPQTKA